MSRQNNYGKGNSPQLHKKIDEVNKNGKYKPDWSSLSEYGVPEWYKKPNSVSSYIGVCLPFPNTSANGIPG